MPPPTTRSPDPGDVTSQEMPLPADVVSAPRRPRRVIAMQRWSRLVHVYSSMVALLLILFFGVTGLTLNHPEWTFGLDPTTSSTAGSLPDTTEINGSLDLLAISQYMREHEDVRGEVSDFGLDPTQGFISYRGPGYSADVTIDVTSHTYELKVENQGWIGVLNDLHRGKGTTSSWSLVIDVAAGFLVFTALAGLTLQLVLRRRRTSALIVAVAGGAIATWVAMTTLG